MKQWHGRINELAGVDLSVCQFIYFDEELSSSCAKGKREFQYQYGAIDGACHLFSDPSAIEIASVLPGDKAASHEALSGISPLQQFGQGLVRLDVLPADQVVQRRLLRKPMGPVPHSPSCGNLLMDQLVQLLQLQTLGAV